MKARVFGAHDFVGIGVGLTLFSNLRIICSNRNRDGGSLWQITSLIDSGLFSSLS